MPEDTSSGKRILIIDDINRGGDALDWIKKDWEKENSLRWANDLASKCKICITNYGSKFYRRN